MIRTAEISADGLYRYTLGREWGDGGCLVWVMLNPSTADAEQDDPTIRRCIGFSKAWGYGSLTILNVYGLRATDPRELRRASDPVGPENKRIVREALVSAGGGVAAWGTQGGAEADALRQWWGSHARATGGGPLECLGTTKHGHPRHPLYVAKSAERELLRCERVAGS